LRERLVILRVTVRVRRDRCDIGWNDVGEAARYAPVIVTEIVVEERSAHASSAELSCAELSCAELS
jgi:hypothetical protein